MIHVKVKVFAQAIPDPYEIDLEEGSSVETLLTRIREAAARENPEPKSPQMAFLNNTGGLVVLLNGMSIYTLSGWKTQLRNGDEVSLLPMFAGG
jgi:molybdopterin converting factor small subunit